MTYSACSYQWYAPHQYGETSNTAASRTILLDPYEPCVSSMERFVLLLCGWKCGAATGLTAIDPTFAKNLATDTPPKEQITKNVQRLNTRLVKVISLSGEIAGLNVYLNIIFFP